MSSDLDIGASSFLAARHEHDECEANGLPRLPNSVSILGRLQDLKTLRHPHLCQYLDAQRNKHERVIVVAEHYTRSLADRPRIPDLRRLMFEVLCALNCLHSRRIVHRNLSPKNILLTTLHDDAAVKLAGYGLFYMTACGEEVKFPIGYPRYMAPEAFLTWSRAVAGRLATRLNTCDIDPRLDIWSFGMVFLEMLVDNRLPFDNLSVGDVIRRLLNGLKSGKSAWDYLQLDSCCDWSTKCPAALLDVLRSCLQFDARQRPSAATLLNHAAFDGLSEREQALRDLFDVEARLAEIELLNGSRRVDLGLERVKSGDVLGERPLEEVYHYWRLTGGDLEALLRDAHLVRHIPPILTMPHFIERDGVEYRSPRNLFTLPDYDDTVVILPAKKLRARLKRVPPAVFYPLLDTVESIKTMEDQSIPLLSGSESEAIAKQPISVKEGDIEYQIRRLVLFDRLLSAYPHKSRQMWLEARQDIPPLLRGQVWAALLQVGSDVKERYAAIDFVSLDEKSSNQINVDLPRCHSYDELLVSPTGQEKMRRVLKAWLLSHPQYEYTQGMDSLCAIFLRLHFNNEPLAFACFEAFIDKYMYNIFLSGTEPLHEYNAVVTQLISFHDAQLSTFFKSIGISLTGFAASWIYTMFAHSFPVHKTMQLWDTVLLGNSSFPMFVLLAIVHQLNQHFNILTMCMEEIFTLFSNFPEVNIDRCREDAFRFFCVTPRSLTIRSHDNPIYMSTHELGIRPLTLDQLNESLAPRISGEDLLQITDTRMAQPLAGGAGEEDTNQAAGRNVMPDVFILDIRSREDFARGCLHGSLNVPASTAFSEEGQLVNPPGILNTLARYRRKIKVVIGNTDDATTVAFADGLVRASINRVCVLQGGIELLRRTDRLIVPNR